MILRHTIILFLVSLTWAQDHPEQEVADLLGEIQRSQIESGVFTHWFGDRYDNYVVDEEVLQEILSQSQDVHLEIYFGTWCHDSKRQVPRLFSILDAMKFGEQEIKLIALNPAKDMPAESRDSLTIYFTPTIIIYRGQNEIGRIIETPVESLERDILAILQGAGYVPNHAEVY